jgi:hypothetical protein
MCCNGGEHEHEHRDADHSLAVTGNVINRFDRPTLSAEDVAVDVVPSGPKQAAIARIARGLTSEWLRRDTAGADLRLLSLRALGEEGKDRGVAAERFVAQVYDYTNNRTLCVCGRVDQPESANVEEMATQPLPNEEEFAAAVDILANHSDAASGLRSGELVAYPAMPPLVQVETPDGRVERTLTVGLVGSGERAEHRLVAVNMIRREVLRNVDGLGLALPNADNCGPTPGGQCSDTGSSGRVSVVVTKGGTTLWQFNAIRPAASSGTNGSGIELRGVRYRGRQVLYQAHVPILNIQYFSDGIRGGCGPTYRDWQNQETCFQANGTDVAPGFRLCPSPAKTIIESGSDAGNFRGVAIFVQGQEVVLVSELSAGWYRYISMWRFHSDGTIRPRFGFAAANNPCTCKDHHHHAYWRLDFDIRTAGNNVVEEYNNPILVGSSNWHTKRYEIRRPRDASRNRHWRVRNLHTNEGYRLIPGADDGSADVYGVGDFWVVRYHGSPEYDDGQGFTTDPSLSKAHIDKFVNGEVAEDRDVVVWYAAHFRHTPGHAAHYIGPDLKPFNW